MRSRSAVPPGAQTAKRFLVGLRLAALLIAAVVLITLSLPNMIRSLPVYQPAWAQLAAFGTLLAILAVEMVFAVRQQSWGRWRWVGLAAVIATSLASNLSLPDGYAVTPADWAFGSIGWIGVILLTGRRLWELVAFLGLVETITIVNLVLTGEGDRATLLSTAAVTVSTIGYPLAGAIAATALRRVARAAEDAAHHAEQVRAADAVAAGLHERRRQRFANLNNTAVPLLEGLASGALDPGASSVQRHCAIEAARMRRLFAEMDTVPNPLLHELRNCADVADRRGILVEFESRGHWPDPPLHIRQALTEAPLAALVTATSWARVTVIGTPDLLSVNVIADCGPVEVPPPAATGVRVRSITNEDSLWVEAQWSTSP